MPTGLPLTNQAVPSDLQSNTTAPGAGNQSQKPLSDARFASLHWERMYTWLPLLRRDVIVLGRKKGWMWARTGVLLVIAGLSVLIFLDELKTASYRVSNVRSYFFVFSTYSALLIGMATPVLGASALPEIKTATGFDLLRVSSIRLTGLSICRLVVASLWPVFLVLGTLPVLILWSLWGGVSLTEELSMFVLLAGMGPLLAALGLFARAATRTQREAYSLAGTLAVFWAGVPPFVLLALGLSQSSAPPSFQPLAWFHPPTALGVIATGGASSLRLCLCAAGVSTAGAVGVSLLTGAVLRVRDRWQRRRAAGKRGRSRSRSVWTWSTVWKTLRAPPKREKWVRWILWALPWVLFGVTYYFAEGDMDVIAFAGSPILFVCVLVAARQGSAALTSERSEGTLDVLFLATTPQQLVLEKAAGAMVAVLPMFAGLLPFVVAGGDAAFAITVGYTLLICLDATAFGVLASTVFPKTSTTVSSTYVGLFLQAILGVFLFARIAGTVVDEAGLHVVAIVLLLGMTALWLTLAIWLLEVRYERLQAVGPREP